MTWIERKACRPEHSALFFPAGSGSDAPDYGPALALCRGCDAIAECRADAVLHGDIGPDGYTNHGQVVGGCTPKQRKPGQVREPVMLPCSRLECRRVFAKRGPGANLYCSPACAAIARKAYRTRQRRRAS